MDNDPKEHELQQCELLSAFAKVACAGSHCLNLSEKGSQTWETSVCILCDDEAALDHSARTTWSDAHNVEDWKNIIAAMLAITREPKFQESSKARVIMAIAIGRVFGHISDIDYLDLETCELGQWLLGSMSRSLRELKIAAV